MKRTINLLNKYKMAIIIAVIIIFIGILLLFLLVDFRISIKTFENNYYTFNYDGKWNISKKSNFIVNLKNGNKATLNIEMINLDDEYKYLDISDMEDDLLYSINSQNKEYSLISNKDTIVTKLELKGYKLLYENDTSQVMVVIVKENDRIVIFSYEADSKYFDILLDSVQNIIYNFELKSDNFEMSHKISVDTKKISYSKNDELLKKLFDTKDYDIANENYSVNYSLPSIFELREFNSKMGKFSYGDDSSKISITTNIYNHNLYDYIDKSKKYNNIYANFDYIKEDSSKYKDFIEEISKYKLGKYNGYIYKVSYTLDDSVASSIENYVIVVSLNKNHIFLIAMEGKNIKLPKELLDSIKINSVKNYSSYVTRNIQNGKLVVNLKRFNNFDCSDYDLIQVNLLEKYREIDADNNIYSSRYFGLNYDLDNDTYQYNIKYILTANSSSIESQLNLENSSMLAYKSYGFVNELEFSGSILLNDKEFFVYNGSYYKMGNLYSSSKEASKYKVYRKLLLYELENGGYVVIVVDGNDEKVNNEILNELSNFEVKKEKYE